MVKWRDLWGPAWAVLDESLAALHPAYLLRHTSPLSSGLLYALKGEGEEGGAVRRQG